MDDLKFSKKGFIERIYELMRDNNMEYANAFEHEIGMRGAVSRWKSGKDIPSPDSLLKISSRFKVSVDWLLMGREFYQAFAESKSIYEPQITSPTDTELIVQVVILTEKYLEDHRLKISKERKGALVGLNFEYCVTEKDDLTPEVIKANLRLTYRIPRQ